MTKLCKQYLSDVKVFFPILGKPERIYLAKLADTIEDYCAEENITTIEEIYDGFGNPSDIVNTYLRNLDTTYLIQRISVAKCIKRAIVAILLLALIGVSIYGVKKYYVCKMFEQEQIYFEEITIE